MLESYFAPRAAQRQDGSGCSTAPLCSDVCWVRDARSPTGTDDSQGRKRLAPLAEVSGPQEAAVTVGYVAAAWLLGRPPRPQGEDSVDGRTLRYLLIVNLALKMKEEERRRGGGSGRRRSTRRPCSYSTAGCSKLRSSPWPNLTHGVLGMATSPARRRRGRGRRRGRKRLLKSSFQCSSSRTARPWKSGHSLLPALRLWQSCPVSGCCFGNGYMYMRQPPEVSGIFPGFPS